MGTGEESRWSSSPSHTHPSASHRILVSWFVALAAGLYLDSVQPLRSRGWKVSTASHPEPQQGSPEQAETGGRVPKINLQKLL